ncbi:malate dehydrogenase MDH2 [Kluyveromyces lactis]|uniref:malate dehydrogenase n=1 Tax=Kluyveromyces lactis (strain ATCC 8585 / CBS 2359 / DSM 70799 / NBRC 1267 / NRRL Y-1140 / WM37) TaxID=284590 RepID=Q6CP51_KLULA|nr:uncharacterized protein KLLA0_E07525g [Kluyveromyces lactis]CAG99375.1 KLLA0E07525p [Kluyveromyces lactis]|eukprot:XP_454288.1 uncharacterized protein KLLA0_E07525g [Kluyveromyces lactis]
MSFSFDSVCNRQVLRLILTALIIKTIINFNFFHKEMPAVNAQEKEILKISVLGAAGGIGQSLSLLLKSNAGFLLPHETSTHIRLSLYDVNKDAIVGTAADLSHIDTPITTTAHYPDDSNGGIGQCLSNASVVIIPAGVPRKPGMSRDDLIGVNAKIIKSLGEDIAKYCDLNKVHVLVISNPINSLVPLLTNTLIRSDANGNSNIESRVYGITQLDLVRSSTFVQQLNGFKSNTSPVIPVIGGHSGDTIIPVFSTLERDPEYANLLDNGMRLKMVHRVQYGGDEIVKAKNGNGSATLSMAYAGFKIAAKFIDLLVGNTDTIDDIVMYVPLTNRNHQEIAPGSNELRSRYINDLLYFSIPLSINRNGIKKIHYEILENLDSYERDTLLPICLKTLEGNIETGLKLV